MTTKRFDTIADKTGTDGPTDMSNIIMIDADGMTRLREVDEYASARGIGRGEAIVRLVNHALSTPAPTRESFKAEVDAGAKALRKAFPTLERDFTPKWFRKAAKIVLLAPYS